MTCFPIFEVSNAVIFGIKFSPKIIEVECLSYLFRLGIYLQNLTLYIFKVFSTVLVTLEALKLKSTSNHMNLSIWVGYTTGPKAALGPVVMKKLIL